MTGEGEESNIMGNGKKIRWKRKKSKVDYR